MKIWLHIAVEVGVFACIAGSIVAMDGNYFPLASLAVLLLFLIWIELRYRP